MKVYVIIVAGGKGERMRADLPKQFLPLDGKPILQHTLEAFRHALPDSEMIVVLPKGQELRASHILTYFSGTEQAITMVQGGATRFHSVQNGLQAIPDGESIIFVHDGVRPLVSKSLISRCLAEAMTSGAIVPAIPVTDSIRQQVGDRFEPIDRTRLRVIQTPQTFNGIWLKAAYQQEYRPDFTDDATVVEAQGYSVRLIPGERSNLKITHPEDLEWAEHYLKQCRK